MTTSINMNGHKMRKLTPSEKISRLQLVLSLINIEMGNRLLVTAKQGRQYHDMFDTP